MRNTRFYRYYLQSEAWQNKRRKVLFRDGRQCQHCGSRDELEIHHLHYRNLGHEKLADLMTLCKTCHQQIHKKPANRAKKRKRHYGRKK